MLNRPVIRLITLSALLWSADLKVSFFDTASIALPALNLFDSAAFAQSTDGSGGSEVRTIRGSLDATDRVLEDGSHFKIYGFAGQADEVVVLELTSSEFDAYLLLIDSSGNKIAEDNNSAGGSNARIEVALPATGTYAVVVNTYEAGETGAYTLSARTSNALVPVSEESSGSGNAPASAPTASTGAKAEADRLSQQGLQQFQANQFSDAFQTWQAALRIYREIQDRSNEAVILLSLGRISDRLSQYSQALEFYQQALTAYRALGDRHGEGITLNNIGGVYASLGQYPQALEPYQLALAIIREVGDRSGEGTTLNNIGEVYRSLGQYPQALEQYQQALAILREVGDRSREGGTLNNIGAVYRSLGQYPQALEQYQQALAISREVGDRSGEGTTLHNIGAVYDSLGQYPQALEQYQQALAISRDIGDRSGEGTTLTGIGGVYASLGQYPQALEQYQQALMISRDIGDRSGEGTTLNNIGLVYNLQGQYSQALEQYQQSLMISRDIGDRNGEGTTLSNIGSVYNSLGQYPQALEQHQQALAISREIGDRNGEASTLNSIGGVYHSQEQYSQALEQYQQALVIRRNIGDRSGEGVTLGNIGAILQQTKQYVAAETSLLEAVTVLESLRAAELNDAAKIAIFDTQVNSYEGLQQVLIAQNTPEKQLKALEISERGRGRAFAERVARQIDPQTTTINPPNLAEIKQIAQQQNATLVQYSIIDNPASDPALYIWVISPTGDIQFESVDLTQLDRPLSELVNMSREAIGVRGRGNDATIVPVLNPEAQQRAEAAQRQNLQKLYQLLIQPIAQYLPTDPNQKVVFIPQGELFLVPFPALVDAQSKYLIENHTILTAPSIQTLGLTHQLRQTNSNGTEALVVGNPIMPTVWDPESNQEVQLSNLLDAEKEAVAIADRLGTKPLMWNDATEAAVVQRMQNARIIHLATHGLLEYGDPQESGVRDLPGAIALTPSGSDDGLLTSAELFQMKLNAELVVLSACDTGRGRLTGDGVIGLSRSLIQAGVPSVIVSLWQVPDAPTAELMVEFYQQWQQTGDKAQALRQAMLTTMQTHPDPKDWAAFTLIGEAE